VVVGNPYSPFFFGECLLAVGIGFTVNYSPAGFEKYEELL
jgi:hypothetical protein